MQYNTLKHRSIVKYNRRIYDTILHSINQFNRSYFKNRGVRSTNDRIDYLLTVEYFEKFDALKEMNT